MCGRTATYVSAETLRKRYNPENSNLANYNPSFNESPGTDKPFVSKNSPTRIETAHWGYIPEEADDIEEWKSKSIINARSETLKEKSLFKESWLHRRCLIPVNGFYEWTDSQPFYFTAENQEVISLAGIFTEYEDGEYSLVIITRPAREFMQGIHDRQPVILSQEEEEKYLEGRIPLGRIQGKEDRGTDFLEIKKHPVTKKMSNPEFDQAKAKEEISTLGKF
jgi:putative SOS response-associated peptidase YedK